jgi:solute:Na+ symporter, SSS family
MVPAPAPGPPTVVWRQGGLDVLVRTTGGTAVLGFMPVVPMVLVSALLMVLVSLCTPKPSRTTLARYFP